MKIHHRIRRALSTPEYMRILILRTIGNFLIFGSLFLIGKTALNPIKQEIGYFIDNTIIRKTYIVHSTKSTLSPEKNTETTTFAKLLNIKPVETLIPENPNFSIVIPKIGANARVIPNVDPGDEDAAPGRGKGSARVVCQAAGRTGAQGF